MNGTGLLAIVSLFLLSLSFPIHPSSIPAAPSPGAPSGLHVVGNRILDGRNRPVYLHGVNRSGPEYSCIQNNGIFDGPSDQASVRVMVSWRINAVRVPLNEDCWLGVNTHGLDPGSVGRPYRRAIARYVDLLNRNGMVAILDLHWSAPGRLKAMSQQPMPDADHTPTFWRSVAATFKSNSAVIFDLYNEPYPDHSRDTTAAWRCWRLGGSGAQCPGVTYHDAHDKDTGTAYRAAGLQTMVNAVRGTGATQLLLVDGIQYADSLSRWLAYRPTDPRRNIVAGWHPYNFNVCGGSQSCWSTQVLPVLRKVPLLAEEIGEDDCSHAYIDRLMAWLDAHRSGYLAWTWDAWYGNTCKPNLGAGGDISVIADYHGTPYPGMGVGYKAHLACIARRACGPKAA